MLAGMEVCVSPFAMVEGRCVQSYHRPLLVRLLHGRTVDVNMALEPGCFMVEGRLHVHPKAMQKIIEEGGSITAAVPQ